MSPTTTEDTDRSLTSKLTRSLIVYGFGRQTAETAAGICAAAVRFHEEGNPNDVDPLAGVIVDDGISQGVSRLDLLTLLSSDEIDDTTRERAEGYRELTYRGHMISIERLDSDAPVARIRLMHSISGTGARYAEWSTFRSGNAAYAVGILRDIDTIIDAVRAEWSE